MATVNSESSGASTEALAPARKKPVEVLDSPIPEELRGKLWKQISIVSCDLHSARQLAGIAIEYPDDYAAIQVGIQAIASDCGRRLDDCIELLGGVREKWSETDF